MSVGHVAGPNRDEMDTYMSDLRWLRVNGQKCCALLYNSIIFSTLSRADNYFVPKHIDLGKPRFTLVDNFPPRDGRWQQRCLVARSLTYYVATIPWTYHTLAYSNASRIEN